MIDNNNETAFSEEDFNPENFENKIPKSVLIEFLQTTNTEKPMFEFSIHGSEFTAKAFIHNMRNELSRLRRKAIEQGRTPISFRTVTKSITSVETKNGPICEICLERRTEKVVTPELDELLDAFCLPEDL